MSSIYVLLYLSSIQVSPESSSSSPHPHSPIVTAPGGCASHSRCPIDTSCPASGKGELELGSTLLLHLASLISCLRGAGGSTR
jgi:hypothetical protein